MKKKILLINPEGTRDVYLKTNVRVGTPILPPLGIAALAGSLVRAGHAVRVLDLDLADVYNEDVPALLKNTILGFKPDAAGLTSITPTWHSMMETARRVKELSPGTTVIAGGVHASRFHEDTLADGTVDYVAIGESDFTLPELIDSGDPSRVPGIAYRNGGETIITERRAPVEDLDALPAPAWELFETGRYRMSHLTERSRPGGYLETSRGCPFGCIYCDKTVFGRRFRAKSPGRVADEIEVMIRRHGFREIHIVDDGFTTDMDRAKEICRLIIRSGLKFKFNLFNGIRADRLDGELCELLKKAGCYQVAFGVESGNDRVLESVSKGLDKNDIRRAVSLCRQSGMETFGFFVIGFPEDTEETIMDTIRFAVELDMTISKFDIAVPLPGSKMFEQLDSRGLIRSRDWRRYIFHRTDMPVFEHPNIEWQQLIKLYYLCYRRTYFRANYIFKRFIHGLRNGGLWYNILYLFNSRWK